MEDITIRIATPADQAALGRYGGALMRQHHALDPQRFILSENPEAGYGRFLVAELDDPNSVVLVAEDAAHAVVGYAYAGVEPMSWRELRAECGFVHDVYVDPGARQRGIGRALVTAAVEWCERRGLPRVVLWAATGNDAAQRLFATFGFRRTMVEMTIERRG